MLKDRIKVFKENASWLYDGVVCHRGKHNKVVKENTLEAVRLAMEDNLSIEVDVRLTKDNFVVVSHDDSLKRIYGVPLKISELSYREVVEYSKGEIPLLSELLDVVNDKVGIMIEIKSGKRNKRLVDEVYNLLKEYKGRFVIISFNPYILKLIRKKDKSIIRGQLSYNYKSSKMNFVFKSMLKRLMFNFISKPHFISYGIDECDYKILRKLKKKGYFIMGWTYKSEKNKEQLLSIYDNMVVEEIELREFK